jgi:hypothetical protein
MTPQYQGKLAAHRPFVLTFSMITGSIFFRAEGKEYNWQLTTAEKIDFKKQL